MVKERKREKEVERVKFIKAPKKMMKKRVKRGEKPTKKILIAPKTMGKGESEMDIKEWVPDLRPCFFKILYSDQSEKHLRIPPHFMKHLTKDMSNHATLKCSSGRFWNIELRTAMGSMYLQDGWQQFLKDNSLGDREFLLFRYDGNMCFHVQIFEKNGCERVGMSVTGKHQEFAVTGGKRKRGRPRKIPLGSPPLRSCEDGPGQSHLQLQSEKFEKVKEGKGILRKIKDEDEIDLSSQEVDSEVKKYNDAKNFQRMTRTGLHLPVLKMDSHTRSCSLERLPPAEEEEEEDEEEEEEEEEF